MRAFVVLGLVFSYEAKRLARGNVSEMTYFVSSGTWNHSSVSYVVAVVSRTSQATAAETFPVQPPHRRQFARIVESRTSFRCGPCVFAVCLVQFVFVPVRCADNNLAPSPTIPVVPVTIPASLAPFPPRPAGCVPIPTTFPLFPHSRPHPPVQNFFNTTYKASASIFQ